MRKLFFRNKITFPVIFAFLTLVIIYTAVSNHLFTLTAGKTENISNKPQEYTLSNGQKYVKRDYNQEFHCEFESNVSHTECLIENLDKASAIREWKQKKIEALKSPAINTEDLLPIMSEEIAKIRNWRKTFESSREAGCIAEYSFKTGSGVPGGIAECELNYEISGLITADTIYYSSVMDYDHYGLNGSKGISDFEPTEKGIDNLMKTNKTKRGCVWAEEDKCD